MKNPRPLIFALAALLAVFAFGVAHLFKLRFEAGDIYPAYSSLRADPLGTKALYQSLHQLSEVSVQRHQQALNRVRGGRDLTLFFLGEGANDWRNPPEEVVRELEAVASSGGRVVLTFRPEAKEPRRPRLEVRKTEEPPRPPKREVEKNREPNKPRPATGPKRPSDDDEAPGFVRRTVSLKDRWGVEIAYRPLPLTFRETFQPVSAVKVAPDPLPESISWHTSVSFAGLDKVWRVVYASGGQPVLIERPWRLGTLVLSADSFFLSNEAMRSERHPDLLAWLIGSSRRVLFDEAHLGIQEDPGIAALARTYRLHGLVAGLLLLAGLFIWKNSVSLVPPPQDNPGGVGDLVEGQDSTAGLVQLLRRNIPGREILGVCFAEWRKTGTQRRAGCETKLGRMQEIVDRENARPAQGRDPVQSYQTLSRILAERKHESKP